MPGSQNTPVAAPTAKRAPVQQAALAAGAVFLLVGIAGFIPGVTTHYDALTFAGHHSGAQLFGLFEVSVLHNIVHLLFGILGLALFSTFNGARGYLIASGVIYLVLFVAGMAIEPTSSTNVLPVNDADNWLHLGLGLALAAAGLILGRRGQGKIGG